MTAGISAAWQRAKAAILNKRYAYRRVFAWEGGQPGNRDAQVVLADLAHFCCANRPTIRISPVSKQIDEKAMLISEGRREVWLRIAKHLNVSDADVARMMEEPHATEQV